MISNSGTELVPLVGVWVFVPFLEASVTFQEEVSSALLELTAMCEAPPAVRATHSAPPAPQTKEIETLWSLCWVAGALPAQLQHLWLRISWLSACQQKQSWGVAMSPIACCHRDKHLLRALAVLPSCTSIEGITARHANVHVKAKPNSRVR
jgi:hypothetical protein